MCERELETEQRLQHIDLPSPSRHRCVSFSFSWTAQPGGPASLGHVLIPASSHQLVSKLNRGSWGPLLLGGGFPYHIFNSNFSYLQLTDFLSSPSYIIVQSPTQSLEWHVWSSSSENNCHAVHRSLSSDASVYECTMGFLPCPIFSAKPTYAISSLNCHFLFVYKSDTSAGVILNIYHYLSPDRIWHKVFFYSEGGGREGGEVSHKLRLISSWTVSGKGSMGAIWARWLCWDLCNVNPAHMPAHRLNSTEWSMIVHPSEGGPAKAGGRGHSASNLSST